jgi:exonuclease VII small subunit
VVIETTLEAPVVSVVVGTLLTQLLQDSRRLVERQVTLCLHLFEHDVEVASCNTALVGNLLADGREPLVHSFESGVDLVESRVDLFESRVDLFESRVDCFESGVDLFESGVDLFESGVDLFESGVDLLESHVDLFESGVDLLESHVDLFESSVHLRLEVVDVHRASMLPRQSARTVPRRRRRFLFNSTNLVAFSATEKRMSVLKHFERLHPATQSCR